MTFAIILMIVIGVQNSLSLSITCYYASWAVNRPEEGSCDIKDLDPSICTHYIYSFVGINSNGTIRIQDPELDIKKRGFYRFTGLKKQNPKLKTLIAIGGWGEPPARFSEVASSASLRRIFVKDVIHFLKKYDFDGLDVDWEYPTTRGGIPKDKENFSILLRELRKEFDKHKFMLTAAVAGIPDQVSESYDVPAISEVVDSIHVMTYDLHSAFDKLTGENSPLYPSSEEGNKTLNVNASIQYWLTNGAPRQKVIMGIPGYGITYTLASTSTEIGAPASGPGKPGYYTNQAGNLAYYEICTNIKAKVFEESWNDEQKVPYAYGDSQWVGYDNPESIKYKMQYALENHLGGVMIWSIDTDDFRGLCSGKYPLLSAINKYNKRRI